MLVRTLEKLQVHLTVVPCQKKGTLTEFHDTVYSLSFTHSFTQSLIYSFAHSLIHSFTHPLIVDTCTFPCSYVDSLTRSCDLAIALIPYL